MRFSFKWLKQHLITTATAEEIAINLNRLGLEVEEFEDMAKQYQNVVVGKIISRIQHPNAEKLGVCQVQVGNNDIRQIVCGAPNARNGLTVAVALEGACLPGDFKITKSKLRGEVSNGMICSTKELALGDDADGIWELETDKLPGTPIIELLDDSDAIFDVDITPNRGDVLSVYGIARDLAARGLGKLKELQIKEFNQGNRPSKSVKMNNPNCSFFASLEITGVQNIKSPAYIIEYLEKAGLRPINAIADITNYVMLDLGQPLHAYDMDKVAGDIIVGKSNGGEELDALDGSVYNLPKDCITINDNNGVIGLGGIVGGKTTCIDESTTNVFLEAAHFDKTNITLSGQSLQINTDAKYRFERGIDPAMTQKAIYKAADLIQQICGGQVSKIETYGSDEVKPRIIRFDTDKMKTFAGFDMPYTKSIPILKSLGFKYEEITDHLYDLQVPSWMTICNNYADVVEEIIRMVGFDAVPVSLPAASIRRIVDWDNRVNTDRKSRRTLASMGYLECLNYSFISPKMTDIFAKRIDCLELANPISEDMSHMRQTLIPGLVESVIKNTKRGYSNLMLAEVGKTFLEKQERLQAAAIRIGTKEIKTWNNQPKAVDVFDIKADLMLFLETIGVDIEKISFKDSDFAKYYHPGRSAVVLYKDQQIAQFGEIHPFSAKQAGIKSGAVMFEVDLEALIDDSNKKEAFLISPFQAVKRDFAFELDSQVKAADVLQTIKSACRPLIKTANIFDLYEGDKLPKGKKSIAISVTLQSDEKTLKDEEINLVAEKAINSVCKRFKAELR